jgi:hypothetical protein
VAISRSGRSTDTCPSQSGGSHELRLSGLREFLFNTLSFFQSDFSRSGRSFSTHPLKINGPGPLRDFDTFQPRRDLWPSSPFPINGRDSSSNFNFQTLLLCILPECFHPESTICRHTPFWIYGPDSLRVSGSLGFGSFNSQLKLSKCFSQNLWSNDTCLLSANGQDPLWPFGSSALQASKVSNFYALVSSEVHSPRDSDLSTRTPPGDQWPGPTSALYPESTDLRHLSSGSDD